MNSVFKHIENYPLKKRIIIITTSSAVILCTISAIINYFFLLHYGLFIVPIISAIIFLFLFYRTKNTEAISIIAKVFISTCLLGLTIVWFLNDGYNSSHSLLIFNALMISMMISDKKQRLVVFIVFFVVLTLLIIIQFYFPDTITHYPSESNRYGDILFSTAYNIFILYYLVNYVLNNYEIEQLKVLFERKRSEAYNEKLKEKNLLISEHVNELDELNKRLNDVNFLITKQNMELEVLNRNQKKLNSEIVLKNHSLETLNNDLHISNNTKDKLINIINKELEIASKYVISLIPKPISNSRIKTDWIFIPTVGLGGDAFGYCKIDKDNFALYLLDVSGHGVGSALHSVQVLNILQNRTLPNVDFTRPDEVLNSLNKIFKMENYSGVYFTICYAVYNFSTSTLRYSGAGHPPIVLFNESEFKSLESQNIFIGAVDSIQYQYDEFKIDKTSSLYIFSDGVFELEKPNKEMYTYNEFQNSQQICGKEFLDDDFSMLKVKFF
jgi:serine phosphatase RsbU (regulator of sigma subunit)